MATLQVNLAYDAFTAPITNSKRSAFGKRGITGGVSVNIAEIPEQVLSELLLGAITDFLQVGLKTLDKEAATQKDCQAAMTKRLALLKAGATASPAGKRKAPTRDPVKAAAKAIVKQTLIDGSDEKLDGKVLTTIVSDLFKQYDAWKKANKADPDAVPEGIIAIVPDAIEAAKAKIAAQEKMGASLADMVNRAKTASAAAAAAKAEGAEEAEAPAPAKPKATPTQKVKAQRAKAPSAGPSA